MAEELRRDFYLYVDEFQNFATGSFIKIMSEARKYHLDIMLANQYMAQIPEEVTKAILGNAGTVATFSLGAGDADILFKEFAEVFTQNDLVNLSNFQIAIKMTIAGHTTRPFLANTLPLPISSNENREKIIAASRERWSQKPVVEDPIVSPVVGAIADSPRVDTQQLNPPVARPAPGPQATSPRPFDPNRAPKKKYPFQNQVWHNPDFPKTPPEKSDQNPQN
jgi:hypothetical protein